MDDNSIPIVLPRHSIFIFNPIYYDFWGDERPSDWKAKRSMCTPGLLISSSGAALLLGREIFILFKEDEMLKAVVTLLASFYLLDLDYPTGSLISLSVLQRIIFGDNAVHPDYKEDVVKAWNEFDVFCQPSV